MNTPSDCAQRCSGCSFAPPAPPTPPSTPSGSSSYHRPSSSYHSSSHQRGSGYQGSYFGSFPSAGSIPHPPLFTTFALGEEGGAPNGPGSFLYGSFGSFGSFGFFGSFGPSGSSYGSSRGTIPTTFLRPSLFATWNGICNPLNGGPRDWNVRCKCDVVYKAACPATCFALSQADLQKITCPVALPHSPQATTFAPFTTFALGEESGAPNGPGSFMYRLPGSFES